MNVLVVDDSLHVRTRFASMLHEIGGVVVVEAASADAALAIVEAAAFAVVLIDIHMPSRSGLELLSVLRGKGALLVAMTSAPNEYLRRACLARGARYFFDKAREFHRVMDLVRAVGTAT